MWEYLSVMLLFTIPPTLILLKTTRRYIKGYLKVYIHNFVLAYAIEIFFDALALHSKMWYFNPAKILGIWLLYAPIENYIFTFFVVFNITTAAIWARQNL